METVITAMTTAFTDIAGDVSGLVTSSIPIVLGVVAITFVCTKGVDFFKRIGGKI